MECTEEIVQLTNDMQKEFNEFGEVTFETGISRTLSMENEEKEVKI